MYCLILFFVVGNDSGFLDCVGGFVGSIAYYYKPILEEAMQAEGLPMGTILQDPIEGLKEYHKDVIVPTTE